jgi:hypothetical protein
MSLVLHDDGDPATARLKQLQQMAIADYTNGRNGASRAVQDAEAERRRRIERGLQAGYQGFDSHHSHVRLSK